MKKEFFHFGSLRNVHSWVGLLISLPLLLTTLTGIILLWRSQIEWIQPTTISGVISEDFSSPSDAQTMESLIQKTELVLTSDNKENADSFFHSKQIEQIILRPEKAVAIVRLKNQLELQFDLYSGKLLKKSPRRTGWLIDLHQGSFLGPMGQYGLMFFSGLGLWFLLISGLILFYRWRQRVKELS